MDTNDTPAGGSRWEPVRPDSGDRAHPQTWTAQPVEADAAEAPPAAPVAPAKPGAVTRGKLALVAGAVGLVAAGGIGGFVLGQSSSATAGTSDDHSGFRPGFDGGEGGFPGGQAPGGTGTGGDPTT